MALQSDYQVSLDAFSGPLDLLLFLIRRAEVDVHDIPIAAITDQYLELLRRVERVDIDVAGEFLVMAATLVEIKSRAIAPLEGGEEGDAARAAVLGGESGDPREDLIQQLLSYQRFRIASEALEARRVAFMRRFPRRPGHREEVAEAAEPIELDLEDVHALDLSEAYSTIMASIDFSRLGDHTVAVDDTPIALYQEDLIDRLERAAERRLTLQQAFTGQGRPQRVGLFMAALELVRLRRILVRQEDLDGEIEITLRQETAEDGADREV